MWILSTAHITSHHRSPPERGETGCKELCEGNCYNLVQRDDPGAPCSAKFVFYREWESCLSNLLSFRSQKIHFNCRRQKFVFYIQIGLAATSYLRYLTHHLIYILMSMHEDSKYDSRPDMHWIFINFILASQSYQKDICISDI